VAVAHTILVIVDHRLKENLTYWEVVGENPAA
jgi:hypothetical protein